MVVIIVIFSFASLAIVPAINRLVFCTGWHFIVRSGAEVPICNRQRVHYGIGLVIRNKFVPSEGIRECGKRPWCACCYLRAAQNRQKTPEYNAKSQFMCGVYGWCLWMCVCVFNMFAYCNSNMVPQIWKRFNIWFDYVPYGRSFHRLNAEFMSARDTIAVHGYSHATYTYTLRPRMPSTGYGWLEKPIEHK